MVTGFEYELWYDGCCLHAEGGFETEEEAREDAEAERDYRINVWGIDGEEYDLDGFEIIINEI